MLEDRKAYLKRKKKERQVRNRQYIKEHLQEHPCVDCGHDDWRVLEFDHLPQFDKERDVMLLVKSSGIQRIANEIAKCEVVCANCHALRTYSRLDSWRTT